MSHLKVAASERKKALLEYKDKLLRDISNCNNKIQNLLLDQNRNIYIDDSESSDSDSDLNNYARYIKDSTNKLSITREELRIRLHATQELTSLQVLQKEINILVYPPTLTEKYKDEELEDGDWKEVIAECRIDLVPFAISFYVHKPYRKFGARTYHNLKVNIVKNTHEKELSRSILNEVVRPSDAINVIRSYAQAHRSRRNTLARLAEKYPEGQIYMDVLTDGGYMLKCLGLLELSWQLENKRSPVAQFYHHMAFTLEYIDEQYIKPIKHFHRQLQNPAIATDERTLLISNIIDICIKAYGHNNAAEKVVSDQEVTQGLRGRKSFTHNQIGIQESTNHGKNKKDKDSKVMAPPRVIPKKAKKK